MVVPLRCLLPFSFRATSIYQASTVPSLFSFLLAGSIMYENDLIEKLLHTTVLSLGLTDFHSRCVLIIQYHQYRGTQRNGTNIRSI